jgi:chromosome segregation ATPase
MGARLVMDQGWLITITGAVSGTLALGVKYLIDKSKQEQEHQIKQNTQSDESRFKYNEQAFIMFRDLVDKLQKNVNELNAEMRKLELDYIKAREENATLRVELHHIRNDLQLTKNTLELANEKVKVLEAKAHISS